MKDIPRAVSWQDNALVLLDQRKLPDVEEYTTCESLEDVYTAIRTLTVRGAPAIGIAAAYGLLVGLEEPVSAAAFSDRCDYLISARPTAVNLAWAVERMRACFERQADAAS
jgi:methylthioribose-1-phosphate isomerase